NSAKFGELLAVKFDELRQAKRRQPKGQGMDPPRRGGGCEAAKGLESPVFPNTRKISRLIVAVAILDCILMKHAYHRSK
uniref:hypothetical protein n=1 Tax=uncultured Dialister sp. TaxID=278064 RepID=UPI0026DCAB4E